MMEEFSFELQDVVTVLDSESGYIVNICANKKMSLQDSLEDVANFILTTISKQDKASNEKGEKVSFGNELQEVINNKEKDKDYRDKAKKLLTFWLEQYDEIGVSFSLKKKE